jgi:hypothetical protein
VVKIGEGSRECGGSGKNHAPKSYGNVLEARDLDHALALAAMTPSIGGGVEVRPIAGSFGIPGRPNS